MHAEPFEGEFAQPTQIHHPDAPSLIVRLGPTLTQVMGFGPSVEVAHWVCAALAEPAVVIGADAFDEAAQVAQLTHDPRAAIEQRLDELEARAEWLERTINALDNGEVVAAPDTRAAAAAMALALEWDAALGANRANETSGPDGSSLPTAATDAVVAAHAEVEAARAAMNAVKRPERKVAQIRLNAALAAERAALNAAGSPSYTEYLSRPRPELDRPVDDGRSTAPGATAGADLIQLRARTAQVLGRLAGNDPAAELRAHAASTLTVDTSAVIDPEVDRDALLAELESIDELGQTLADQLAAPVPTGTPPTSAVLEAMLPTGSTLVIDGDLLYAVSYDEREAILNRLRDVAMGQRVVLVSDDTILDAYVDSVPRAMLWSSGHLHLVNQDAAHWDDDPEVRGAAIIAAARPHHDDIAVCANHPGSATRLSCPTCHTPLCSLCLIIVDRRAVECVACALGRGGVRAKRWRN